MTEYYLPPPDGPAEFVEKKARFIGEIWPVSTAEEARQRVEEAQRRAERAAQKMEDAMKRAKLAQEQLKKAQAEAEKLKNQNKKT